MYNILYIYIYVCVCVCVNVLFCAMHWAWLSDGCCFGLAGVGTPIWPSRWCRIKKLKCDRMMMLLSGMDQQL